MKEPISLFTCLILSIVIGIFTSCQTGYHPTSATGGYVDHDSKFPSLFITSFGGNGYTTGDRAYDLAMLRSAEKAWREGYRYFIVWKSDTQVNHSGNVAMATAVPMYGGGAIAFGSSSPIYTPRSSVSLLGYSKKPDQDCFPAGTEVYETSDFIQDMMMKYRTKVDLTIFDSNAPISNFEDWIYKNRPSSDQLAIKKPIESDEIIVFSKISDHKNHAEEISTSGYQFNPWYPEFPYEDLNSSIKFLKRIAKECNSDYVVITPYFPKYEKDTSVGLRKNINLKFLVRQKSSLGIKLEPGLLADKIFQVRNLFHANSSFKLGDKILEINGKDTLEINRSIGELYYRNKPGDKVPVKVSRNGELVSLEVIMGEPFKIRD